MVRRSLPDVPMYCVTDEPRRLPGGVTPLEPVDLHVHPGWWQKTALFRPDPWGLTGRILYLDLDVIVVGDLNRLVDFEGTFRICPGFFVGAEWRRYTNSSAFVLDAGAHPEVWEHELEVRRGGNPKNYHGDQEVIEHGMKMDDRHPDDLFWPQGWVLSFKKDVVQPDDNLALRMVRDPERPLYDPHKCVLIACHGHPDPWEATLHPIVQRYYPLDDEQRREISQHQEAQLVLGGMKFSRSPI